MARLVDMSVTVGNDGMMKSLPIPLRSGATKWPRFMRGSDSVSSITTALSSAVTTYLANTLKRHVFLGKIGKKPVSQGIYILEAAFCVSRLCFFRNNVF